MDAGNYQRATEVFEADLGDSYSDEDVTRMVAGYESTYGQAIIGPGDVDEDGNLTAAFKRRAKKLSTEPVEVLSMDPHLARRALAKAIAAARVKGYEKLTKNEIAVIHELQTSLGIQLTDFTVKFKTAKQIAKEAQAAYAEAQQLDTFKERLEVVDKCDDAATLDLFAQFDPSEEVREAALERIAALGLAAIEG